MRPGAPVHLVNAYHVKVEPRSNNAIATGLSSFQATTQPRSLTAGRGPAKAKPTDKKLRAKDRGDGSPAGQGLVRDG
jgi:hypothetical protein